MIPSSLRSLAALGAAAFLAAQASSAAAADRILTCSDDRWSYPFAFSPSPATRTTASVFSAPLASGFDYRDGQMLLRFRNTTTPGDPNYVPANGDPDRYGFTGAKVVIHHAPGTYTWDTRTPATNSAGRPFRLEIFGMGVDAAAAPLTIDTWVETTAFQGQSSGLVTPSGQRRNPHPLNIDAGAAEQSEANNIDAVPWGLGLPEYGTAAGEYTPGVAATAAFPITFTLDVSNPRVRAFIQEGLVSGGVEFVVCSTAEPPPMTINDTIPVLSTKDAAPTIPGPYMVLENFTLPSAAGNWSLYE